MTTAGAFSFREITSQAEAWRSAIEATTARADELRALIGRHRGGSLIFIGCGSTYCLAQYAAGFFQRVTGRPSRGLPSSELYLQTDVYVSPGERPLVVALSRSGETSETIMAVQKLCARGCEALAISCYDATELSRACSLTVSLPGGREESYAQTRSFAGMLVAAQMAAALTAGDEALLGELGQLPALADDLIRRAHPVAQRVGADETVKRITYLASGPLYGLAAEATVKVKEMSLSVAEAYHFMEFRHGPMALVDAEHLIVALLSDELRAYELAVLRDLKARGSRVLAIANRDDGLSDEFDAVFALQSPLPERARGVLYMPLLQLLAYYRAMGRRLNPDRPRHVVMAIRLQGTEMV